MAQPGVPLLALALAAAASSRLHLDDDAEARLRVAFTEAVAQTDDADRAYRSAVEQTLPHDLARAMLTAMASFREAAQNTRGSAVRELKELYQRHRQSYGWFDPLDSHAAPAHGLNHADATRAATIADRARAHVDALRAQANERVAAALTVSQIETLRAAKLGRREAFEAALRAALRHGLDAPLEPSRFEAAVDHLTALAEGWY